MKTLKPSWAFAEAGVVVYVRSRFWFGFGGKTMLVPNAAYVFMSAVLSCEPPMSELNAPLNAWKLARSPRQWSGLVAFESAERLRRHRALHRVEAHEPEVERERLRRAAPASVPPGSPRSHAIPSMSPSTWQEAHDIVPLPESFAS